MRINFRYGAVVGMLAAVFSVLGPVSAPAAHTPGTSVPVPTSVQAQASHLPGIAGRSIMLTAKIQSPALRRDTAIAGRTATGAGLGRERIGLPGQQDRMLVRGDRCWYGYYGRCRSYGNRCWYGYWDGCYGYGHGYYDHGYYDRDRYGDHGYGDHGYGDHGYGDHGGHHGYGHFGHESQVPRPMGLTASIRSLSGLRTTSQRPLLATIA